MARPGARPGGWTQTAHPRTWAQLPASRRFTVAEMERLREGLVPQDMDDRWFIVWTGETLDFVRSWSGHTVFRARFEPAPFGERLAAVQVNRDPEQYGGTDAAEDLTLCFALVDGLLLARGPLPRTAPPRICVVRGDLAAQEADVLVNAANEALAGGGGVDGAIHRAAGEAALHAACRSLPVVGPRAVRCPTGEARLTPAFALHARWVAHAVGPVWGTPDASARLTAAFDAALDAAVEVGARTVALPALSCGAFGAPPAAVASLALAAARRPRPLEEVRFVLLDPTAFAAFEGAAAPRGPTCRF